MLFPVVAILELKSSDQSIISVSFSVTGREILPDWGRSLFLFQCWFPSFWEGGASPPPTLKIFPWYQICPRGEANKSWLKNIPIISFYHNPPPLIHSFFMKKMLLFIFIFWDLIMFVFYGEENGNRNYIDTYL